MEDDPTTPDAGSQELEDVEVELKAEETPENDPDAGDGEQPGADADKLPSDEEPATAGDETPALDADLDKWAQSVGKKVPETDRERELMQELRNSQRDFTREAQAKSQRELEKTIRETAPKPADDDTIVDPLEKDMRALQAQVIQERNSRLMSEYLTEQKELGTPVTNEEQEAMKEVMQAADIETFNVLAKGENIDLWRAAGQRRLAATTDAGKAVADKARREERERLAKETRAGGPNRNAHSNTPAPKKDELAEMFSDL